MNFETAGSAAREAGPSAAMPWLIALLATSVWLCALIAGPSLALAQFFGVGLLFVVALNLGIVLLRSPRGVCRPVSLFYLACIYFFILDAAFLLHGAAEFDPAILIEADTLIATFVVVTVFTHTAVRVRRNFLATWIKPTSKCLSADTCFSLALLAVLLECLRRASFEDFSLDGLWHDLLLGRSGGAFRIGVSNDWRVVLAPIGVLFLATTLFSDLAWRRGISPLKKAILLIVVAVQLAILVLDTVRGDLLMAILMPAISRASQNERFTARTLGLMLLGLPLLIPLMNAMNYSRNGWQDLRIGERIFQEPGEDDFFWLTNLVAYRSQAPGLLRYKGPLGFAVGLADIGREWVTIAIPRVLWREKPRYWEEHYETRGWYAADSVVGDLFGAGGVSCVIGGAVLFGLWLSLLDCMYLAPKTDEQTIAYVFLTLSVVSITRDALPFNSLPLILSAVLCVVAWNLSACFVRTSRSEFPCSNRTPERTANPNAFF